MATLDELLAPPACVCGMKVLQRESFRREVQLPALKVPGPAKCSVFLQRFHHVVLRYPGAKKFVTVTDCHTGKEDKLLLLSPEELRKPLTEEEQAWLASNGGETTTHTLTMDYSSYNQHALLRAILPTELVKDIPTSFETVGHIAHINLREEQLPYKAIIGQILLDKHSHIRTVVNKTDQIDDTFRFFKMEFLAGEEDTIATVSENGCSFTFDFSKVYWNSRLHTEHKRIVEELRKDDVVMDVFAGVGPFAIPTCVKGCVVYANDLNPHSYSSLCENAKRNRVSSNLKAYNMDGREFMENTTKELVEKALMNPADMKRILCSHVIMNLPASAVTFLDAFRGLYRSVPKDQRETFPLPKVHCYCFSKSEKDPDKDAVAMVERNLGHCLEPGSWTGFRVRDVAPNKLMMRVSFQLPASVAYSEEDKDYLVVGTATADNADHQPPAKRKKVD